jgi:hypothetical protein
MLNDSQTTESRPTGETLAGGLWQGVCEVELMVREKPNVDNQRDDGKGSEGVTREGDQRKNLAPSKSARIDALAASRDAARKNLELPS